VFWNKQQVCETRRGSRSRSPEGETVPDRRYGRNGVSEMEQSLIAQTE